ncbi:MAG: 1-deoxy-D-xylulose-5-phosphate reductoisomerase [Dehalococcoidia bacterium]|nr:1-deoxy-D-xylulose-5-phosphate reductoisomerase [Dehalococcoidia bacterium]MSQ34285.1 1-deoxy-D-xylulose-5-phosphate reductoisomerase [Dehalococcoidia bacterium]
MERNVKRLAILGSTGSIGRQTLEVVRCFPDEFEVVVLCAGRNIELLKSQVEEFRPTYFCQTGEEGGRMGGARHIPPQEAVRLPQVDIVVAAMAGSVGMGSTIAALQAGKKVALANKEPIVMAGELLMQAAAENGAEILPVDSEPSAIWQCMQGETTPARKLILTASGGAFRDRTWESLRDVTPAEALRHPTWQMGHKITVDSATLMNKAFEVVESRWLFGMPFERIEVVVHRQSIIHSMVEFEDGSVKAQMGPPDMRFPIQYALFHPDRRANGNLPKFDPVKIGSLTFEAMKPSLYPCFELAMDYARRGGTWPAVLAGADEAAVALFLDGKVRFTDLPDVVSKTLGKHTADKSPGLEDVIHAASWAFEQTLKDWRAI